MNLTYFRKNAIILGICCIMLGSGCGRNGEAKYSQLLKKYDDYFAENKLEEARLSIQSAIDIRPKEADGYYKLAEVLLRQQKFGPAVENYRSAINYNPKHRDARYRLASMMLAARDYESAEDNTRKILETNPKDIDALILKANIAASSTRKDFVEARRILDDVLKENPKHVNAIASLGMIALQQEELKEAEDRFLEAQGIDAKNVPIRLVLADLYAKQGRLDESQRQLESVLQDDPGNANIRFGFAEFLLKRGLGGQAEEQYAESLKSDPLRHDARDRLYDIHLARREVDKARALTKELEKDHAENPGTEYFRGRDLELEGKLPKALEKYLVFIKAQTTFAPAFRRAAFIQLASGDEQAGLENLNKAITVDPGDVPARLELATRALNAQRLAEASEQVNQVLARFPRHLAAHILRADIAVAESRFDEARKVYKFLIDSFPKSPAGYTKLAILEERDNHADEAINLYRKALAFDVNVMSSGQRFARLLLAKSGVAAARNEIEKLEKQSKSSKPEYDFLLAGLAMSDPGDAERLNKARGYLTKAVEMRPGMSAGYFALASLDAAQGNKDSAAANYEKVAQANPKHVPSRVLLASIREQQGKADEAMRIYREVLAIDPKIGIASNNLAWLLAEKGTDLDDALKYGQMAKERMPEVGDAADTLGWIHFKRGSYRAALPFIQEALVLNERNDSKQSNAVVNYHLAEVQLALDNKPAAREAAERALSQIGEKHPTYARLQEIMQKAAQ